MQFRRLPLEKAGNARDLGGYPAGGAVTKYGGIIRMDDPSKLSERDVAFMKEFGLRTSLDLRSEDECAALPSKLSGLLWVDYRNLPLFDVDDGAWDMLREAETLGDFYVGMAKHAMTWIRRALEAVAQAEWPMAVNCTAGKDRTGIICAMILGLCGVKNEDIIADYCVSAVYLSWEIESGRGGKFVNSDASNLAVLISHLEAEYGGIDGYLEYAGVRRDTADAIRRRLLVKYDLSV